MLSNVTLHTKIPVLNVKRNGLPLQRPLAESPPTLLLFDDGTGSVFHNRREKHAITVSRKYQIDASAGNATEIWHYYPDPSVYSPFCSSVYEDAANITLSITRKPVLICIPASLVSIPRVTWLSITNMTYWDFCHGVERDQIHRGEPESGVTRFFGLLLGVVH